MSMRITIKGTNLTVTPEIRAYLDKRLAALQKFPEYSDMSAIADIELGRTTRHHEHGNVFRAEINLHRGSDHFRAVAEEEELMTAIDRVQTAIIRELESRRNKQHSLFRRGKQIIKKFLKGNWR